MTLIGALIAFVLALFHVFNIDIVADPIAWAAVFGFGGVLVDALLGRPAPK